MAQDNQLEFPSLKPSRPDEDGRLNDGADFTRREDKDALFASIAEQTKLLEDLFNEEKYEVQGGNYLQKHEYLYQMKDPREVARRVETRARVRRINKELDKAVSLEQRRALDDEKNRLLAALENSPLILNEATEEKLTEAKRNKLRTNWVNAVLGRLDLIVSEFSNKRLGYDCGFDDLYSEIEQKQAQWKQLVVQEKRIEKQLHDLNDADVPSRGARAVELREALEDNRRVKMEFVTVELQKSQQRALHLMRDLRRRLLGEKLEV